MIRIALASLLLFASASHAEDILQPTIKELALLADVDSKSTDRPKIAMKYEGKLIQITGPTRFKPPSGRIVGGVGSYIVELAPNDETAIVFLRWGPGTEKTQNQLKEIAVNTKKLTTYGRLSIDKSGFLSLLGATTEKANAGKIEEPKK